MRIITIGDPHFKTNNILEVNLAIDRIKTILTTESVDYIVVLGDVLHTHEKLHTEPLNKALEFFNMLRQFAPTFVLVGNHDYTTNTQYLTTNHWMNALKDWDGITIVDTVVQVWLNNENTESFLLVPYVFPGRFEEALRTKVEGYDGVRCIFAHQEFYGCNFGIVASTVGDVWNEEYPLVISGHIHNKHWLQKNIYYAGSLMQHAFGESEDKTIAMVNIRGRKVKGGKIVSVDEINLNLTKKKIIYSSISNIKKEIKTLLSQVEESPDEIKLTLNGTKDEIKNFRKTSEYKVLIENKVNLCIKQTIEPCSVVKGEEIVEIKEDDFYTLLSGSIESEGNDELTRLYKVLILGEDSF